MPESESPFIAGTQVQFAYDSTSLGLLKQCPRKYYYQQILGYRPKDDSVHLVFGGIFAKALELYHKYILGFSETGDHIREPISHDDALDEVVAYTLLASWEMPENDKKTRQTLVRSVIWYLDLYKDEDCKTVILHSGKPAVELSFKFNTQVMFDDINYIYCGHIDRLVEFGGDRYVMDQKTTGGTLGPYFFTNFNPDNQMSGYSVASQVIFKSPVQGVIIDGIQIAVGFTAFGRSITTRTESQLDEWLDDFAAWTGLQRRFAEKNRWPMNDKSCHQYGGCVFRKVCSHDERVRKNFLETDFEVRHWNPLEER